MTNEVMGFESIKGMYETNKNFQLVVEYLKNLVATNGYMYEDHFMQDAYLFKGK